MKRTFDEAFWTGAVLFIVVAVLIAATFIGVSHIVTNRDGLVRKEIVHDTIKVEVVREIECDKPHVQPKPTVQPVVPVQPVEKPKVEEPKDTTNKDI